MKPQRIRYTAQPGYWTIQEYVPQAKTKNHEWRPLAYFTRLSHAAKFLLDSQIGDVTGREVLEAIERAKLYVEAVVREVGDHREGAQSAGRGGRRDDLSPEALGDLQEEKSPQSGPCPPPPLPPITTSP